MILSLDKIRIDGGTQPRAAICEDTVKDYADAKFDGAVLPPIDVFFDGVDYWLADGFHRYHAYRRIALDDIEATVYPGTRRDAVLFSVGVNQAHGLRRTNADKRKAVMTLLNDPEWSQWSNVEIGKRCGVSEHLPRLVRDESLRLSRSEDGRTYTTKQGTEATMRVEHIGRSSKDARPTDIETRRSGAVVGASIAMLKRLPRKTDAEIVSNTTQALRGILTVFETVDPAPLSNDPRAEEWRAVVAETIAVLRSFNKRLERKAV